MRSGSEPKNRGVSPWIKALVLIHLAGVVSWALPRPRREILVGEASPRGSDHLLVWGNELRQWAPLSAYTQATGSWQYWDMFAPDPAQIDQYADAIVVLRDGTQVIVGYPRMYELGLGDKYLKERYRKFFERAGDQNHSYLWPRFALLLAREAYIDRNNPPVSITLRRHKLLIVPPGKPQPTKYTDEPYFRYFLSPGELDAGT